MYVKTWIANGISRGILDLLRKVEHPVLLSVKFKIAFFIYSIMLRQRIGGEETLLIRISLLVGCRGANSICNLMMDPHNGTVEMDVVLISFESTQLQQESL
jgi:hypothetical protein